MIMNQEQPIWSSSPSLMMDFLSNLSCAIIATLILFAAIALSQLFIAVFALIPVVIIFWNILSTRATVYELTTQRIKLKSGVLNRKTEEVELYRVKDYKLEEPLLLRIFSLGNIVLETSDHSNPVVTFYSITQAQDIMEKIRINVEECRKTKGIREIGVFPQ